jgi:hypothetical protein
LKAVSGVTHPLDVERLGMVGPGETLASPWPPLVIRPWTTEQLYLLFYLGVFSLFSLFVGWFVYLFVSGIREDKKDGLVEVLKGTFCLVKSFVTVRNEVISF